MILSRVERACIAQRSRTVQVGGCKVLKWWRHRNEISEIMGFARIFWKNNVQEAYLPKMTISWQSVSEMVAQLCLENSIQTLLNFFGVDPKKIRRVCIYGVFWVQPPNISETISVPEMARNAHFWQVGLLDIVLSEYPNKFHNFRNFIFMTSSL